MMSLPQNKQRTAGLVGIVLVSCLASRASQVGAADSGPVLRTVAERRPALTDSSSPQSKPSGQIERLLNKIHRVSNHYYQRTLTTQDQNCWEVMHWIIAYGVKSHILRGGSDGLPVNSIGWLCYGGRCAGQPLVYVDQGRITASKGPHVQGHQGQFLAILAQAKAMKDYPMRVGNQSFTVADLIETEKLGCQSGMELTFKLIALAHYLDLNDTWRNSAGEEWSVARLVQEEIKAPIRGAACGGTHRLMGLSYAVHERQKRGAPLDGQFHRADTYIRDFHRYAFSLQNADGSFSTNWFKGPEAKPDLERRLQTTGHILEWLAYSVPSEMLDDPRLVRGVDYLATLLFTNADKEWPLGTLGHGLHALALFDERIQKERAQAVEPLARRRPRTPPSEKRAARSNSRNRR
ncbi:MAG TPA: hypothetical protein VNH11_19290 [Pirellulales bacterium]|nr:hypothetical protein [Pirellulales bacterium]